MSNYKTLKTVKRHFWFFLGLFILLAIGIASVYHKPKGPEFEPLEKTSQLFGLSIISLILIWGISFLLITRWLKKNEAERKETYYQIYWGIAFLAFSLVFVGLTLTSLNVTKESHPEIFFIFRQGMIFWVAAMWWGLSQILQTTKNIRVIPAFLVIILSEIWFLYGLFLEEDIELTMYGFLTLVFVPMCFSLAYLWYLYSKRRGDVFASRFLAGGHAWLGICYLAWAPWHFGELVYIYFVWYALFTLSLVAIFCGFLLLTQEVTTTRLSSYSTKTSSIPYTKMTLPFSEEILNQSLEMLFILDQTQKIKFVNDSVKTSTGWSLEDVLNQKISKFIEIEDIEKHMEETILGSGISTSKGLVNTKMGEVLNFDFILFGLPNPEGIVEQLMLQAQGETSDHSQILQQAEELAKVRTHFLASSAHEFRSPLTSIHGFSELALSGKLGRCSQEVQSALKRILRLSKRLEHLVDDIHDLSRLDSETLLLRIEIINSHNLINEVIEEMGPIFQNKAIDIVLDLGKVIKFRGDRERLLQVLSNVISNSIKFTPSGGIVEINATTLQNKGIYITIKDSGIGVEKSDLDLMFQRFYRTETSSGEKGSGLGLSLARSLVHIHRGKIWAESEGKNMGTTIHIQLPKEGPIVNTMSALDIF